MSQTNNNNNDDENNNDRSEGLRKALMTIGEAVEGSELKVGSTVVIGNSIPNLNLWQFQSYELVAIYDQGMNPETGVVEKIQRPSLLESTTAATIADTTTSTSNENESDVSDSNVPAGYTRYIALYSPKHHKDGKPVIVLPQEVELSSMQEEVVDSVLMALPLFAFWTALAFSFANQYTSKTGGSFVDALFGR